MHPGCLLCGTVLGGPRPPVRGRPAPARGAQSAEARPGPQSSEGQRQAPERQRTAEIIVWDSQNDFRPLIMLFSPPHRHRTTKRKVPRGNQ
eukprot:4507113-Prymnesium_polylepis.1